MGKKGTKIDLTGQTRGRWQVLEDAGHDKHGNDLWKCKCSCKLGTVRTVRGYTLRNEGSQSCGCLQRELLSERVTTHGLSQTRLYHIWQAILSRTGAYKGTSEKNKRNYIDRGITVCDEWLIFENFRDWALSHGYADDLELDRIDNDKGYCPENCRWVSYKENNNNKRNNLRLPDGTPLAMFCTEVGIETVSENGKQSKQYTRIAAMFRRKGKAHPELLKKANEYLTLLKRLQASLNLLAEVREFRHEHKIRDPKRATN